VELLSWLLILNIKAGLEQDIAGLTDWSD